MVLQETPRGGIEFLRQKTGKKNNEPARHYETDPIRELKREAARSLMEDIAKIHIREALKAAKGQTGELRTKLAKIQNELIFIIDQKGDRQLEDVFNQFNKKVTQQLRELKQLTGKETVPANFATVEAEMRRKMETGIRYVIKTVLPALREDFKNRFGTYEDKTLRLGFNNRLDAGNAIDLVALIVDQSGGAVSLDECSFIQAKNEEYKHETETNNDHQEHVEYLKSLVRPDEIAAENAKNKTVDKLKYNYHLEDVEELSTAIERGADEELMLEDKYRELMEEFYKTLIAPLCKQIDKAGDSKDAVDKAVKKALPELGGGSSSPPNMAQINLLFKENALKGFIKYYSRLMSELEKNHQSLDRLFKWAESREPTAEELMQGRQSGLPENIHDVKVFRSLVYHGAKVSEKEIKRTAASST